MVAAVVAFCEAKEMAVRGFEYRSAESWRGIPVVHVAFGYWEGGRYRARQARAVVAVGDTAIGLVAVGFVAVGGVPVIVDVGVVGGQ